MPPRPRAQAAQLTTDGPELIFAVVKPVGTPDEAFRKALEGNLLSYGYRTDPIKLSSILEQGNYSAGSRLVIGVAA